MKAIKGSEVRAGMKLQTEDGQIITVTKVIKPVKDRLYNRAGGRVTTATPKRSTDMDKPYMHRM